jgi:hypothetical protein
VKAKISTRKYILQLLSESSECVRRATDRGRAQDEHITESPAVRKHLMMKVTN